MYSCLLKIINSPYYSQDEGAGLGAEHFIGKGTASHTEGSNTRAKGTASHAEGSNTRAEGTASHAEGGHTVAQADYSHVEGANTLANGVSSHAEGNSSVACGNNSHAEGTHTITGTNDNPSQGDSAHAEGYFTIAFGNNSHVEGNCSVAYGNNSHAEGTRTTTGDSKDALQGDSAHAEGYSTTAYGEYAHAEGFYTFAQGESAHAEGFYTFAQGKASHAEGVHTVAEGDFSHAEGVNTQAMGEFSHTEGIGNFSKYKGAHIMGKYGDAQEPYSWFIGNGLEDNNRELGAKWLSSTRNMYIDGTTYVASGTNYAEMFEVRNGTINVGFFVTFEEDFVRKATNQDDYILGITTDIPSILGNSAEMRWKDKYLVDEWGRIQYKNTIGTDIIEKKAILNPKWDSEKKYKSRIERADWVSVGLIGQIRVRDDGTCKVGEYCFPNMDGIATKSKNGYRVIRRISSNQIIIILK